MIRQGWTAALLAAACAMVGCNPPSPGTTRPLGTTDPASAFAAGKEVFAQYYSIESSDPLTGVIVGRPKPINAPNERLLGGSPARELATLRIAKEDEQVVGYAEVAVQRQGGSILRQLRPGADDYDTVPDKTPAEHEGATTTEQNESWRTLKYDHEAERRMLQDVYRALHPQAKP